MAREIRAFTLTIPPGTTAANPLVQDVALPERRIDELQILVPPGPSGFVGFAVLYAGVRLIPYLSDQWIITAGESINWPLEDQPTAGDWSLAGYNTGTVAHSIYFRFLLSLTSDPAATGLIPFDVAAVNAFAPNA
jgi:hypothetical protein